MHVRRGRLDKVEEALKADRFNRKRIDEWLEWGLGKATGSALMLDGAFEALLVADLVAFSPALFSVGIGVPLLVGRMTLGKAIKLFAPPDSPGSDHA